MADSNGTSALFIIFKNRRDDSKSLASARQQDTYTIGRALELPAGSVAHKAFRFFAGTDSYVRNIEPVSERGGFGNVHQAKMVKSDKTIIDVAVKRARGFSEKNISQVNVFLPYHSRLT